jgi:hypothetical protein
MRNLVILGALGILLAGCVQEIKYSSSETIFRGTWNGTASQSDHVMAVRLNLTSEYVDISTYTVVGTGKTEVQASRSPFNPHPQS